MLHPELYSVADITRPDRKLLGLYALRTLSLCLFGPWFLVAFVPMYFKYRTLRYRFESEGITTSWGILWRREVHLTYSRIQDIHLSRGLLERWLGLATIHVQTASGNAGAELSIVGVTEFEVIRDFLYSRMHGGADPTDDSDDSADETLALLQQLLGEVRLLRERLTREPAAPATPSKCDEAAKP